MLLRVLLMSQMQRTQSPTLPSLLCRGPCHAPRVIIRPLSCHTRKTHDAPFITCIKVGWVAVVEHCHALV